VSWPEFQQPCLDVVKVVCGGTLGIFLAAALQLAGLRVAVVERGPLAGRAQEWNISRKEIAELVGYANHEPDCHVQQCPFGAAGSAQVDVPAVLVGQGVKVRHPVSFVAILLQVKTGVLTREEAEQCVSIEFNPIRAGFDGSEDIWVRDVLNLGFSPVTAVELVRLQKGPSSGSVARVL
jgi:hypothetical protein